MHTNYQTNIENLCIVNNGTFFNLTSFSWPSLLAAGGNITLFILISMSTTHQWCCSFPHQSSVPLHVSCSLWSQKPVLNKWFILLIVQDSFYGNYTTAPSFSHEISGIRLCLRSKNTCIWKNPSIILKAATIPTHLRVTSSFQLTRCGHYTEDACAVVWGGGTSVPNFSVSTK